MRIFEDTHRGSNEDECSLTNQMRMSTDRRRLQQSWLCQSSFLALSTNSVLVRPSFAFTRILLGDKATRLPLGLESEALPSFAE